MVDLARVGQGHPQLADATACEAGAQRRPVVRAPARAGRAGRPARGSRAPDAAHIRGNIDVGVKPGIVLTSLTTTAPSGSTKKSTRARPSHVERLERRHRQIAHPRGRPRRAGRRARRARCSPREVLRLEVVELVLRRRPGSRRRTLVSGARRRGPRGRRTRPRVRPRGRLDEHLRVVRAGVLDRRVEVVGVVHLGDAEAGAGPGGLRRTPGSRAPPPPRGRRRVAAPTGAGVDHDVRQHRQAGRRGARSFMKCLSMPTALESTPAPT